MNHAFSLKKLIVFFLIIFTVPVFAFTQNITPGTGNILYVKKGAIGSGSGSDWNNAIPELGDALDWANDNANLWTEENPLKIYVAKGTYKPTRRFASQDYYAMPHHAFFLMVKNVQVYGGFPDSGSPTLAQRNWQTHATILKGEGDDGNPTCHVAVFLGEVGKALLDGFTITGANHVNSTNSIILQNNGTFHWIYDNRGAGIYNNYASPILSNLNITENTINSTHGGYGAGVYNLNASPKISDVTIQNNKILFDPNNYFAYGAGLYNDNSSPELNRVTISGNVLRHKNPLPNTNAGFGGGIYNIASTVHLKNSIISGNSAERGGGIYNHSTTLVATNTLITGNRVAARENTGFGGAVYSNYSSQVTFTNATISGNSTDYYTGGIINEQGCTLTIYNSIVWNNNGQRPNIDGVPLEPASSNNLIQGGHSSNVGGIPFNLNMESVFINPVAVSAAPTVNGNYRLKENSFVIDKGSTPLYTNTTGDTQTPLELANNPRIRGMRIDIGAYEFQSITPGAGNILYVDKNNTTNSKDGDSWSSAIPELADALKWANENQHSIFLNDPLKIWVAAGTYTPLYRPDNFTTDASNKRLHSFVMVKNVQLYGGFNGTETELTQRNWQANETILSGDLNNNDEISGSGNSLLLSNINDNAYHVVIASGDLEYAALNGFTITGGNSNNNSNFDYVNGNAITLNNGGGIIAKNITSNTKFEHLKIIGNHSGNRAGGFYNEQSVGLVLDKIHFTNNRANYGSALFTENAPTILVNNVFNGNKASNNGGALYTNANIVTIINSTFQNNHAASGGAIYSRANTNVVNSIIWGNSSAGQTEGSGILGVTYSIVQGGYNGIGNIDEAPLFINAANNNFRLRPCSPAINAGNNAAVLNVATTDFANLPRIQLQRVDMGALEANSINNSENLIVNENKTATAYQLSNAVTYYGSTCNELIAAVAGNNTTTSVSGETNVKLWIENEQSEQFVKRHYEITPIQNAATATGKITLYFTQQEFDDFNAVNTTKLPAYSADELGKANLLIEKRSGTSTNNTGLPNSYTGNIETIDPVNEDIVWNAAQNRWEVTFSVTGFSGFFIKTQEAILPLKLLSFTATEQNCKVILNWQTAQEENVSHFEIEQSADGVRYFAALSMTAKGRSENDYIATLPIPLSGVRGLYYRLKMVDIDGQFTYSNVATITTSCNQVISIYPNPAKEILVVTNANPGEVYRMYNTTGQLVKTGRIISNAQSISLQGMAAGMYFLHITGKEATVKPVQFVKE